MQDAGFKCCILHLFQQWSQDSPNIFDDDIVTFGRWMNPVLLIEPGTSADPIQEERD